MLGKNFGVCHGYRSVGHFFDNCPIKRRCTRCAHGFQKFFEVERDTVNKGKFFKCCSKKCGFWEWCKDGETTAESSNGRVDMGETVRHKEVEDMSKLNDEDELLISLIVNVTVRGGRSPFEVKAKRT